MEIEELSFAERKLIRKFQKEKQFEFAQNLLNRLNAGTLNIEDPISELTPMRLLDALGCEGLSLTIAEDASKTFVSLMETQ